MSAPQTADPCGCTDYGLTRRALLRSTGLIGAAGVVTSMLGDVLTSTVYGSTNGNVLVVLSLRGGADGLSMVVPHAEQAYYDARRTSAIEATSLLHADATFGLHPDFAPLSPWWESGKLAAVHAVGLPAPNRSHFEAMEELEDADLGSPERIGWINRMISGLNPEGDVFDAMQLGSTMTPTSLVGPAPALATSDLSDLKLPYADNASRQAMFESYLRAAYESRDDVLASAATQGMSLARRARTVVEATQSKPFGGARYAAGALGKAMAHTAGLIRAGLGVRAVALDADGWDHHVGLRANMSIRIDELATNLAAFFTDLGAHAGRVTVVTLSEFGRRLQENGASGVDHGYGSCVLVMGAGVKGGYHARWPGLAAEDQVDGDLAVTTDYRDVVAEILRARFAEVDVSRVFPGLVQAPIGVMSAAS